MIPLDSIPQMGCSSPPPPSHEPHPPGLARLSAPVPPPDAARRGDLLARPHARRPVRRRRRARASAFPSTSCGASTPTRMVENYEEALAVLRAALTTDSLTFHGDNYHFDDVPDHVASAADAHAAVLAPGQLHARGQGRHEHRGRRPTADGGRAGGEVSGCMRSQRVGRWRRRRRRERHRGAVRRRGRSRIARRTGRCSPSI